MVSAFPKHCLWRRGLCSNLGGTGPEKLYRATLTHERAHQEGILTGILLKNSELKPNLSSKRSREGSSRSVRLGINMSKRLLTKVRREVLDRCDQG